jgi:hypothetical protein
MLERMIAPGILALLNRALTQDCRSILANGIRFAFVGFMLFSMLGNIATVEYQDAPGLTFFGTMISVTTFFLIAGGLSSFSNVITEEKEDGVIGLLRIAGISRLGLLLGKSTSRQIQALVLLSLQVPFFLLAVTMGGLTYHHVFGAYLALAAHLILVANLGLLCSVLASTSTQASRLMTALLAIYYLAPWIISSLLEYASIAIPLASRVLDFWQDANFFKQLSTCFSTSFTGPLVSTQFFFDITAGAICFFTAWIVSPWLLNDADETAAWRIRILPTVENTKSEQRAKPNLVWSYPIAWKDYHFLYGGGWGALGRVLGLGAVGILVVVLMWSPYTNAEAILGALSVVGGLALFADASHLAGRAFAVEIKDQTLSTLILIPNRLSWIIFEKVLAAWVALFPTFVMFMVPTLLFFVSVSARDYGTRTSDIALLFGYMFWGVSLFWIHLNLTALLSLYLRNTAFLASVGIVYVSSGFLGCCAGGLRLGSGPGNESEAVTLLAISLIWLLIVCSVTGAIWTNLVSRIKELAHK